jgi:phage-related holin
MMKNYLEVLNFSNFFTARTGFIGVTSGAAGSVISKIYGGEMFVYFVMILLSAIAFDWIGALAAAKKDGSYASAYGIQGIMRVAVMLALPAFGGALDHILGTPNVIFSMFWGGLLFHTLISMSANFKRAGWNVWIPVWAIDWVSSEIEAKMKRSESRTQNTLNKGEEQ